MDHKNKYTTLQQEQYDQEATNWTINNRDPVVGSFDKHNAWKDYDDFLFKNIQDTKNKTALDFGCGPGRNVVKFANRFHQIDGADISDVNLSNARLWFNENNLAFTPELFKNNGTDLSSISSDTYDVVFSTICFQHICSYDIRFNFLKEFYRVLKNNGHICFQMGFGAGKNHPRTLDYYNNDGKLYFDTRVESADQIKLDLEKVGFSNFDYDIRPVGPGDSHDNWIFFRALKK